MRWDGASLDAVSFDPTVTPHPPSVRTGHLLLKEKAGETDCHNQCAHWSRNDMGNGARLRRRGRCPHWPTGKNTQRTTVGNGLDRSAFPRRIAFRNGQDRSLPCFFCCTRYGANGFSLRRSSGEAGDEVERCKIGRGFVRSDAATSSAQCAHWVPSPQGEGRGKRIATPVTSVTGSQ